MIVGIGITTCSVSWSRPSCTAPDRTRSASCIRRAFEWLRDDGEVADAIRHGLAAGEVDAAADLLSENNFPMVNSGRAETARALVAMFPT